MATVDNELNWRRVFPSASIDVSGWTLAERMMLPDWCFPNRMLVGVHLNEPVNDSREFGITDIVMPDPMCIWEVNFRFITTTYASHYVRIGLAAAVPTTTTEMNATQEILDHIGRTTFFPHRHYFHEPCVVFTRHQVRKGMVSNGLYLVMELYNGAGHSEAECAMVVSGLPTKVPAFLNPKVS